MMARNAREDKPHIATKVNREKTIEFSMEA